MYFSLAEVGCQAYPCKLYISTRLENGKRAQVTKFDDDDDVDVANTLFSSLWIMVMK